MMVFPKVRWLQGAHVLLVEPPRKQLGLVSANNDQCSGDDDDEPGEKGARVEDAWSTAVVRVN